MSVSNSLAPSGANLERVYRRNFIILLIDGVLFMAALGIMGPSTVIPDFVRRLTDSEVLIGLSSSLFEVGWLIPQLFIARYLVRAERKKWWFVGPNIPVRFAILVFAGSIVIASKTNPSTILLAFFIFYGIAAIGDGLVGVPWIDLAGSSLDNRWRARMFGLMTALSGMLMLGIAPVVGIILGHERLEFPTNYAALFGVAGIIFVITIPLGFFIKELPGGNAARTVPPMRDFIPQLGRLLREDRAYRAMVITRTLTSLFNMAGPFYIGFATEQLGMSSAVAVPRLLAMQIIGSLTGALIYSWMGNRHNLLYIRVALLTAALLPVCALIAGVVGPFPLYIGFFVSGMALSNLFNSYVNWIIMHAAPEQRPVYTGLFNTVAALSVLMAPLIGGTIAEIVGYEAVFVVALVMVILAFYVVMRHLKPVRQPEAAEPA